MATTPNTDVFRSPMIFLYSATPQENTINFRHGLRSVHTVNTFDYKPLVEGPA